MPELPEVETTLRALKPVMANCSIQKVTVRKAKLRVPLPDDFGQRLAGRYVTGLHRRGKYLLIDLKGNETMLVHLGMSGSFTITDAKQPLEKHDHVVFDLTTGKSVRFNDPRRFGLIIMMETWEKKDHPLLCHLGPEPLQRDEWDADVLLERLKGKTGAIKQALMNNTVVVGIGNIYANEILFCAGILPTRRCPEINHEDAEKLVETTRAVLEEAIEAGGSSLRDFKHGEQKLGYFQHQFQVYNRAGEPCKTKGCRGKIEKTMQGGRATFFCRCCQK